jgi:uncharacterized secreted protein with C-terminal beta-propeller domain
LRHQRLVGGLFLSTLLIFSSCAELNKKRTAADSGGLGPKRDPDAVVEAPPASSTKGAKGARRYRTCDELQHAVYRALLFKQQSDARFLAAQRKAVKRAGPRHSVARTTSKRVTTTSSREPRAQAAPPAAKGASAAPKQAAKKLEQFTNIQEVGVDEPDHVKIGPDNVYLLRGLEIQVANRKTLKHRGVVVLEGITKAKKLLITAQHLFVLGEQEVRMCGPRRRPHKGRRLRRPRRGGPRKAAKHSSWGLERLWRLLVPEAHAVPGSMEMRRPPRDIEMRKPVGPPVCPARLDTVVQAYALRADGVPRHVRSWRFKGRYMDARMTAGRIVLIFQQRLNLVPQVAAVLNKPGAFLTQPIPKNPITLDRHNRSALLSCGAIYRSNMFDQDYRLTKVVAISASVLTDVPKQAGFVGGGDQIYMSTENLYIAKVGKRWIPRDPAPINRSAKTTRARKMRDSLVITQLGFSSQSGEIEVLAQTDGTIRGRPKDQWAFKELTHNGTPLLGVFTTTGKAWSKDPQDVPNNYLWILKRSGAELPVVARLADIAHGETIRSVRYIGTWAYAVTFKKTDPLFAIDLSNPLEPKIIGQLKIPGFSTYMHPVGEGRLIGIGFDVYEDATRVGADSVKFQGIKLSLFDVSNPRDMRELDTMVFGERGSYSDVTGDHHAFFYDAKLKRLAFPLTLLKGTSKTEKWKNKRHITFAGAVLVQIGGEKLRELAKWRHNRFIPVVCHQEMQKGRWWEARTESQDINRVYRIGQQYLTASRYGLKTYPVQRPQRTRRKLRFPGEFADCGIGREK